MSTSEPAFFDRAYVKRLVIINALVPAVLLSWDAYFHQLGANEINFAIRTTGMLGLVLTTLALAVTPVRLLTGWNLLVAVRRNLGVLGFCYLVAHFLLFFAGDRDGNMESTIDEIIKRPYLWFGTAALVLMLPLAITSTDEMVVALGAKRWKKLQRLVYVIAVLAVIHFYMLVKSDIRLPVAFGLTIGLLFGLRLLVRPQVVTSGASETEPKPRYWIGELQIVAITRITPNVKTFRFAPPDGGTLPFSPQAGQYLNLLLTIDGRRVNRSYTISSAAQEDKFCEISVKALPDGRVSRYLHSEWQVGTRVRIGASAGKFTFAGYETKRVVMIAGGIGITPLLSVIRTLARQNWNGQIYLLYAVRKVEDIAFRQELEKLQKHSAILQMRIVVSQDPHAPWDGARGHITQAMLLDFVPTLRTDIIMLCGPDAMMHALRQVLVNLGVPAERIREEAFISAPDQAPSRESTEIAVPAVIAFRKSQKSAMTAGDQTLLEASEALGLDLPFECRSGICGQCKVRLSRGRVTMEVDAALHASERSHGWVLACQARPLEDCDVDA